MTLARLNKVSASTVIGIDASTNSVAFCLFRDGKTERYGKILLNGMTIYEKIADARNKIGNNGHNLLKSIFSVNKASSQILCHFKHTI